jgi:predicted MPP superfamily phosphohydrolase
VRTSIWILLFWLLPVLAEERLHVYVGDLGPEHVLLAWGHTHGKGNTIGRAAESPGRAVLRVGEKTVETTQAWAQVNGLAPDREYDYSLTLNGQAAGSGKVRTWPARTDKVSFLVLGDWGNASKEQNKIAQVMTEVVRERAAGGNPVRFVLSTGDNIYSVVPGVILSGSGDQDSHWGPRFFQPYEQILRSLPFYVVLGNHDGNESERRGDLALQLDNFFYPGNRPARWYHFQFGGLLDLVALDTTRNTETGGKKDAWAPDGAQTAWARAEFAKLTLPWRIVFQHHPIFNAGPRHHKENNEARMKHFLDLFEKGRVQAVFSGHEHNFQVSERNARSRGIRFFVTGAGGELRDQEVVSNQENANIAGWAPQNHFLLVEIERNEMKVTPLGFEPVTVRKPDGSAMEKPVVVLRESDTPLR